MDKPFYLRGTGPNLVTPKLVQEFITLNPDLKENVNNHDLELKTLNLSYLESFCAWILSQQISGRVAELLLDRFRKLVGEITPENILKVDNEKYRDIGFSRTKVEYIKNIARFFDDPTNSIQHENFTSSSIKDHYMSIRGVGDWTVNMFLIFNLGRMDVKAPKDLVIRKGLQVLYELDDIPNVKQAEQIMNNWGHLGTIGCILSWAAMGE